MLITHQRWTNYLPPHATKRIYKSRICERG